MSFASVPGSRFGRVGRGRRLVPLALLLAAIALSGCALGRTLPATEAVLDGATLHGTVFSNVSEDADYFFEYGKAGSPGSKTATHRVSVSPELGKEVSERLGGLEAHATYEFRLCAHGSEPRIPTMCGDRLSFRTDAAASVTTAPPLQPKFAPGVSDYVTRCTGDPVQVNVTAASGTTVAVDGGSPRGGGFSQSVPLAAGQRFDLTTSTGGVTSSYHVRCLPPSFPGFTYSRPGQPAQDWTLVAPALGGANFLGYIAFFDDHGVPVWWYRATVTPADAELLSDGTLAYSPFGGGGFEVNPSATYQIRRLDGTLVRTLATVGTPTDFHDIQRLANGNYLLLSYRPRAHVNLSAHGGPSDATVVDAEIQELTPGGSLVWSWNSRDHIGLDETDGWWPTVIANARTLPDGTLLYDPVHANAIEVDGNSILLSLRQTDAVYSISRSDGHVEWKLGGTTTPQSLTVLNDPHPSSPFGGQHDVRRLADGTVSVHDNGSRVGRPPRAVRYWINTADRTATLVDSLSDPDVPSSNCCGSARRLATGQWLVSWGGLGTVAQYAPDDSLASKLTFSGFFSYRAVPVSQQRVSAATLRQAMDTMFPR
jgi:Arylsulfotransferase (ASST)